MGRNFNEVFNFSSFGILQSNKEPFICAKISIRDVRLSNLKVRNRLVHFCVSWDLWTLGDRERAQIKNLITSFFIRFAL